MANTNRFSTYTSVSAGSAHSNRLMDGAGASVNGGGGGSSSNTQAKKEKKDLWNSMLDSVASGRKLPERNMLVFGGSVESQREFVESLGARRPTAMAPTATAAADGMGAGPPIANRFALGYTYYDVLDADQDGDMLARVSLYMLSKPAPSFAALLRPLLTPDTIPGTLIVVLLDWAQPWRWLRQLREWILLLRTVLVSLSPQCKEVMEEAMADWRGRGRGGARNLDGTPTTAGDGDALPPGPGEWEDALGLPLCVVCQNSEKTDILEKTQGWKDDEFDLVLQYLRTVLVKHGASLIYTTPNVPSQLPTLLHACLGITSLLKRQPLKPEVIKRTEVVVPSNWDSWTKILVVREGFEVDKVSTGWSMDLQRPFHVPRPATNGAAAARAASSHAPAAQSVDGEAVESGEYSYDSADKGAKSAKHAAGNGVEDEGDQNNDYDDGGGDDDDYDDDEDPDSAVSQYERAIRDPGLDVLALAGGGGAGAAGLDDGNGDDDDDDAGRAGHGRRRRRRRQQLEVETEDVQLFLGEQLKLLDQFRQKDEAKRDKEAKESKRRDASGAAASSSVVGDTADPAEVISSHIGPVQFNIGGIQVDADDMLERIKNRHGYGSTSPEPTSPGQAAAANAGSTVPADGTLAPENVDTEKMTAFFADLMNRPSQTRKA